MAEELVQRGNERVRGAQYNKVTRLCAQENNYDFIIKGIHGPAVTADENLDVYRVVKKQSFSICISTFCPLAQCAANQVDFRAIKSLTATLRYQTDHLPGRVVSYVKANPLEYTTKISEESNGSELEVEAKINTLSSQHQGSYFYIHFQIQWEKNTQVICCKLNTPSIQVISKKSSTVPIQRRKPATDIITAALHRIEESECEKTDWLSKLCSDRGIYESREEVGSQPPIGFSLLNLCSSFRNIPNEQREYHLAGAIRNLNWDDRMMLESVIEALKINSEDHVVFV